ncbi:rhomboid family intramembrane serine protease [Halalkalibacter urbisdiaboli]|uniref:rhomboid family intramembrane serine protease n=1 Tax=Halalkalibacter urbisdiaboli TaxID=1960589 RepID=UPI000B4389DC|nr:rhomboid family intramembrane serine protease [Halalkalibacter urbisdiaboli]
MDTLRHDHYFWQLVHYFVFERECRVLELKGREVWLEEENTKPRKIIRLVRADIDWANWLKRDIVDSVKKFELIRRHLRVGSIEGENIYVTLWPPVDSWEHLQDTMTVGKRQKTRVHTTLLLQNQHSKEEMISQRLSSLQIPRFLNELLLEKVELDILAIQHRIKQRVEQQHQYERSLFLYGKPFATYVLLAAIVMMYLLLERNGGSTSILTLIEFGAKYNPLILEGEWWRFFSSMFLHIGFLHLFMNSLALFYLGAAVERIYGTWRFIVIYSIAGLFGSIASFAFNEQVAAGASGAIFGCFGALLYFGTVHKKLFFRTMGKNLIVILVLNLMIGFAIPMIDNGAHLGGLVAGFLASAFVHLPKHRKNSRQFIAFALTCLIGGSLFIFGLTNDNKAVSELMALKIGQEYLQQEEIRKAYPYLKKVVDHGTELPEAYFLLAYAEASLENYEEAKQLLLKTIELRPTFHEAYYNLSLVFLEFGEEEEALASISKAVELNPDEESYKEVKERIEAQ